MKPVYVPCGADWRRDLMVYNSASHQLGDHSLKAWKVTRRTSGGIASAHIATPAEPPANMTAGRERGGAGAGSPFGKVPGVPESFFLRVSYVAK
jgi:hypothetical protein